MIANKPKIKILPNFETIKLNGVQQVNEHGVLVLSGYLTNEEEHIIFQQLLATNSAIGVTLENEDGNDEIWFNGIATESNIYTENDQKILELKLMTATCLMDHSVHFRTFQSQSTTYQSIVNTINKKYEGAKTITTIDGNKNIAHLVAQYRETDFAFAKRMASHFNTAIIPDARFAQPTYYIGLPKRNESVEINTTTFHAKKDLNAFFDKKGKGIGNISEMDTVFYEYKTRDVYTLGEVIRFNGKKLRVSKIISELEFSELMHTYTLCGDNGLLTPTVYNERLIGLSLKGRVCAVSKDQVEVSLDNDENKGKTGTRRYPYATPYSTPDGTGWYFMPEIDDQIIMHFPTEKEESVYVANSVYIN